MAQSLTFALDEQTGKYQATATVNSDFNLHIAFANGAQYIDVLQQTDGNTFGHVSEQLTSVMDADFINAVYPKTIKILCTANPTEASVTES